MLHISISSVTGLISKKTSGSAINWLSFININSEVNVHPASLTHIQGVRDPGLSSARSTIPLDLAQFPSAVVVVRSDPKIRGTGERFLAASFSSKLLRRLKLQQSLQTERHTVALRSWRWLSGVWTIRFGEVTGSRPFCFWRWSQGCQKPMAKQTATMRKNRECMIYLQNSKMLCPSINFQNCKRLESSWHTNAKGLSPLCRHRPE